VKNVPGWNKYVKPFYDYYRDCYAKWIRNDKPETGLFRDEYIAARKKLKKTTEAV